MFSTRVVLWRGHFVLYDGDDFILPIKRGVLTRNKVSVYITGKRITI